MKRFLLTLLICCLSHPAFATLSLDGTPASNTTPSAAITTTKTNDVIVFVTSCYSGSGVCSVSGVSGGSLTWNLRKACDGAVAANPSLEIWYAIAPSTLSSQTITATFTNAPSSTRVMVFAVNGANTTTPFDVNSSAFGCTTGTTAKSLTINQTTTNANTMPIAFVRSVASLGTITEPSGFSLIVSGGANEDGSYTVVSSQQSSTPITYSWTATTTLSAMLIDALQAPSAATPHNLLLGTSF